MAVHKKNLYHIQNFQKQAHDKALECRGYTSCEKVWLNSKYIKTK